MHGERTGVDFAFRIQESMEFLAGGPAIQNFHASDFDDPMPGARFESGGFHVENNLSHGESLKDHGVDRAIGERLNALASDLDIDDQELLRDDVGFTSPPIPCARSRTFGRIGVSV